MLISLLLIFVGTGAALMGLIVVRRYGSPSGSHYRNMPGQPTFSVSQEPGSRYGALLVLVMAAYGSNTKPLPCDAGGQPMG